MSLLLLLAAAASAQDVYDASVAAHARLWGSAADEFLHGPVAAGDWDGNGITDTAVGNFQGYAYYYGAGEVQILDQDEVVGDVDLDDASVSYHGGSEHDYVGTAVLNFPQEDGPDGILIGADHSGLTDTDQGQILLWTAPLNRTGWQSSETADVVVRGDDSMDLFGRVVERVADLNGDGLDDWAVGAPARDNSYTEGTVETTNLEAGRVWLVMDQFRDADGALNAGEVASTTITGSTETLFTGWRICGAGDHDGDGGNDLVVGTLDQDEEFAGELLVFTALPEEGGINTTAAAGSWVGGHPFAYAGTGLACGDPDADGIVDVWAGGPYLDGGAGRVWHVAGMPQGKEPLDGAALHITSGEFASGFGSAIAYGSELLIGAPYADQVWVGGPDLEVSYLLAGPPGFGAWVGWPGDLNKDGVTDAALVAPNASGERINQGVALILSGVDLLTGSLPPVETGTPVDLDADGFPAAEDCDDLDPRRSPLEDEVCKDGLDNNCDGTVDESPCRRGGCATAPGGGGWVVVGLAAAALARRRLLLALPLLAACQGTRPLAVDVPGGVLAGVVDVTVTGNYDQVAVLVDGVTLGGGDGPSQSFSWDTRESADGEHLVTGLGFLGDNPPVEVNRTVEVDQSSTDNTPPSVHFDTPADGEQLPGDLIPIVLSVSDDVGLASVEILANDSLLATLPASGPFELAWENVLEGDYVLSAVATDLAGNGGGTSIDLVISNLAPVTCTVSSPDSNAEVYGDVEVKAGASSSAGIVSVEFFADKDPLGTDTTDSPWSVIWATKPYIGRTVELGARCTAADGGVADAAPIPVLVSSDAPPFTVLLREPEEGATVSGDAVTIRAILGDGQGPDHADFFVDDTLIGSDADDAGGFTWTWNTTTWANGAHVVKVIGYELVTGLALEDSVTVTVSN